MTSHVSAEFLKNLAQEAGDLTLRYFRSPLNAREKAGNAGLVSEADIETEKFIIAQIRGAFPEATFLAEESSAQAQLQEGKDLWIIDPIDGTTNFLQGNIYYNVSIGLYQVKNGKAEPRMGCVVQPYAQEVYFAETGKGATLNDKPIKVSKSKDAIKGCFATGFAYNTDGKIRKILDAIEAIRLLGPSSTLRVNGAAALDMCRSAEGILDAFWEFNLSPWDMAAGAIIVREAGGLVTNFLGAEFDPLKDKNVISGSPESVRLLAKIIGPLF